MAFSIEKDVDCVTFTFNDHLKKTFKRFEEFRKNSKLCDIKLIVGEKKIQAHRLVLAAFSDYFSAMFTGDMSETSQFTVHLTDMKPDAVEALIRYAYTSEIEIRVDNVENLLSVACILQIEEVKEACSEFMANQLHPSNCLGIRAFADGHGCSALFKTSDQYTKEHFVEVINNQEFFVLPAESVAELLSSDDLNVPSETQVFTALKTWTQQDLQNRKQFLHRLLSLVRLPLLSTQYLIDHVESCPLFRDISPCRELILEAMKYQLLPNRRLQMQSPRTKPRKSTVGKLFAVGGKWDFFHSFHSYSYPLKKNWKKDSEKLI